MNDNVKASDTISGDAVPDAKTAEILDRINGRVRSIGTNILSLLPPNQRMLQLVCRAIAHEKVAPEFAALMSNVAVLLSVTELVKEMAAKGEVAQGEMVDVASLTEGQTMEFREGAFIEPLHVGVGAIHDNDNVGRKLVSLSMRIAIDGGEKDVLHVMPIDEAHAMAQGIIKAADFAAAGGTQPAPGVH